MKKQYEIPEIILVTDISDIVTTSEEIDPSVSDIDWEIGE